MPRFPRNPIDRLSQDSRCCLAYRVRLATLLLGVALVFSGASAQGQVVTGRVIAVSDGDTVTVLDGNLRQRKIRLSGIDAPEKKQAFGERSRQSLSDLLMSRLVVVHIHKKDRYGRELGRIEADQTDLNLEQLHRGMAWHYVQYESEQPPEERKAYREAETMARAQKAGLWADKAPQPPWLFRQVERTSR